MATFKNTNLENLNPIAFQIQELLIKEDQSKNQKRRPEPNSGSTKGDKRKKKYLPGFRDSIHELPQRELSIAEELELFIAFLSTDINRWQNVLDDMKAKWEF